jgi:hypothetical protein
MTLSAPPRRKLCRLLSFLSERPKPPIHLHSPLERRPCKGAEALPRSKQAYLRWLYVTSVVLLGTSLPASASLGGDAGSVESDRAQMNASIQVTQHSTYAIHEIQVPGGTVVDEYVASNGKVFAVTWHGQFPPPMQQILGTYFQQYSAALQARSSQPQPKMYGHGPLNLQEQGLVVQMSGHMRAHSGRAYIPGQLPPGMTVNQIQ